MYTESDIQYGIISWNLSIDLEAEVSSRPLDHYNGKSIKLCDLLAY